MKRFALYFLDPDPSWEITTDNGKDHTIQHFCGPMGLDGFFAGSACVLRSPVKARWTSQHTFEIDRSILGHSETKLWTPTFDGNNVYRRFQDAIAREIAD